MSINQIKYLKKIKRKKIIISIIQIMLLVLFILIWELLSSKEIINSFIFSSPSKIIKCIIDLYKNNNLFSYLHNFYLKLCKFYTFSLKSLKFVVK